MSAPAPEDLATAHAEVLCPLESFNKDILETYPDKAIQEDFVENTWKWLARNISAYDYFVRGIHSKPEVRNKLEVLDGIAPLSDLPDIRMEMELPEKFGPQSTILLPVLKSMFSVPLDRSLRSVICLSSDQIRRMNFSYVLRAILAYILHQEIFSVEENALFWRTIERCLKAGKSLTLSSRSICQQKNSSWRARRVCNFAVLSPRNPQTRYCQSVPGEPCTATCPVNLHYATSTIPLGERQPKQRQSKASRTARENHAPESVSRT